MKKQHYKEKRVKDKPSMVFWIVDMEEITKNQRTKTRYQIIFADNNQTNRD